MNHPFQKCFKSDQWVLRLCSGLPNKLTEGTDEHTDEAKKYPSDIIEAQQMAFILIFEEEGCEEETR